MISTIFAWLAIVVGFVFCVIYGGAAITSGAPDHLIGRVLLIGFCPIALGIAILVWG